MSRYGYVGFKVLGPSSHRCLGLSTRCCKHMPQFLRLSVSLILGELDSQAKFASSSSSWTPVPRRSFVAGSCPQDLQRARAVLVLRLHPGLPSVGACEPRHVASISGGPDGQAEHFWRVMIPPRARSRRTYSFVSGLRAFCISSSPRLPASEALEHLRRHGALG